MMIILLSIITILLFIIATEIAPWFSDMLTVSLRIGFKLTLIVAVIAAIGASVFWLNAVLMGALA